MTLPSELALLTLPAGEVHLWLAFEEEIRDPQLLRRYHALLTPEEAERHAAFRFERDRHRFLVTRALVRSVLSRYVPAAPDAWRFAIDTFGKPSVQAPACEPPAFNLSHTEGLVAMAVARAPAIGVDAENFACRGAPLEVARSYFSPAETAWLFEAAEHLRPYNFFRLWTLKEAYIKARGKGLSIPLDQFGYRLSGTSLALDVDAREADDPGRWTVAQHRASSRHLVACCAQAPAISEWRAFRAVPLLPEQPLVLAMIGMTAPRA